MDLKGLVPPDGFYVREIKQIFSDLCHSPARRVELGQESKWMIGIDRHGAGKYTTGYGDTPEKALENAVSKLSP
jgi:hypothetical protein